MVKKINISFNVESINQAINRIEKLKNKIINLDNLFLDMCLDKIQELANNLLDSRSKFNGNTDIRTSWHRKTIGKTKILYNDSKYAVIVEFGTGLVGESEPHPLADELYEYNVNSKESWNFVRELGNLDWDNHVDFADVKAHPEKYLVIRGFQGYEGKYYLYDAVQTFFLNNMHKEIYQNELDKILKSI